MMADFPVAIELVLKHEGGYVDVPLDKGGPTHFGITIPFATDYFGHQVDAAFIAALTLDQAKLIYERLIWDQFGLGKLTNQNLATVCLDLSVLRGRSSFVKALQKIGGLEQDGIFGPVTLDLLIHMDQNDAVLFSVDLICAIQNQIIQFVANHLEQLPFIVGWMRRTANLLELVLEKEIA